MYRKIFIFCSRMLASVCIFMEWINKMLPLKGCINNKDIFIHIFEVVFSKSMGLFVYLFCFCGRFLFCLFKNGEMVAVMLFKVVKVSRSSICCTYFVSKLITCNDYFFILKWKETTGWYCNCNDLQPLKIGALYFYGIVLNFKH